MNSTTKLLSAAALSVAAIAGAGAASAATTFTNRAAFEATLDSYATDTYSSYSTTSYTNAAMSAVFGETQYETTGHSNANIIFGSDKVYCAGCNGSFRLSFADTSYSSGGGVFGVGADYFNAPSIPYSAFVRFSDSTTQNIALSTGNYSPSNLPNFFGITSTVAIVSIHFALNDVTTRNGAFGIDNLTIGNAPGGSSNEGVPEPGAWALMIVGFGMAGGVLRRGRRLATSSPR